MAMRTIVLASRKGGAGKTTLTCHLAVEAERQGHGPVGIIDTDDMAGLAKWWDAREAASPILARAEPDLGAGLAALQARGCNLALIDTPPAISAAVAAAIAAGDLVVIPVQPSPDDLRAVGVTVEAAEAAGKPLLFVINRVKPRARLTADAAVALSQHGAVAPAFIFDRVDYAAAKINGQTAPELEPDGRAAAEVAALWDFIANRIGVSNGAARDDGRDNPDQRTGGIARAAGGGAGEAQDGAADVPGAVGNA
jgi:chromosome partitioning protein